MRFNLGFLPEENTAAQEKLPLGLLNGKKTAMTCQQVFFQGPRL
jgi:hypothetical protein